MIRAVLFDLDGVLVDTYEVWFRVMNEVAENLGYPAISRERFQASWGQGVEEDVASFFWGRTVAELERQYALSFPKHLGHLRADPDAAGVLSNLRARGVRTAVITNTPTELAGRMLAAAGLEADVLVGGTGVRPKPAPDMVLRACELLGVPPAQAILVGDSRYDREAAAAAGVSFAGYKIGGQHKLNRLGDIIRLVR